MNSKMAENICMNWWYRPIHITSSLYKGVPWNTQKCANLDTEANVTLAKQYGCGGLQYPAGPKGPQAKNSMLTRVQ